MQGKPVLHKMTKNVPGIQTSMFSDFEWQISKNIHISANRQQIAILRAHYFLQLLKFEKAKYLYFFDYRLRYGRFLKMRIG